MVDLQFGAAIYLLGEIQATVESNRLSAPYGVWVEDNGGTGGNTGSRNTVMGGSCGLKLSNANQGDTTNGNTYFKLVVLPTTEAIQVLKREPKDTNAILYVNTRFQRPAEGFPSIK